MPLEPLTSIGRTAAAGIRFVLTDIDDTLSTDGRLTAAAYAALERLQQAGYKVLAITGRPAGWCDLIARFWPVDGVVGENGAFYFRYCHQERRMVRHFAASEAERAANRRRLDAIAAQVLARVPGAAIAADQAYRVADLAIDFREDVSPLPPAAIDAIVGIFTAAGATAKVSSIHVNGWFGAYDKLAMTRNLLATEFAVELPRDQLAVLFVGDSPNDEPMFAALPLSVGVANVLEFKDCMRGLPAYVTMARSGEGFVELADYLLAAQQRVT